MGVGQRIHMRIREKGTQKRTSQGFVCFAGVHSGSGFSLKYRALGSRVHSAVAGLPRARSE